jgi:hypothetical protein
VEFLHIFDPFKLVKSAAADDADVCFLIHTTKVEKQPQRTVKRKVAKKREGCMIEIIINP